MSKTEKWILGCLVIAVILLFGGGAIAFLLLVPDVSQQLPPSGGMLSVRLTTPRNDATLPLNSFTSIQAEANGTRPITALELWIDGTPSETKNAPAGTSLLQFDASWSWTPAQAGEHTLIVRAVDADQNTGMSNVVRVTAAKDANEVVPSVAIQTKPGDTIGSLAKKDQTTPQQIIDLNPQINPNGPIASGQTITVPFPVAPPTVTPEPAPSSPPEPPGNPNEPPANNPPNKYIIWWNHNIAKNFVSPTPPAAPGLTTGVGVGYCAINLYIHDKSDNEEGFFIYQLDPVSFGFKRIATLDAHSGTQPIHYIDPVASGKYMFYVSSFNAWGESPSKFAQAAIYDPCGEPQGSLQLNNAQLTVNQPVDKVYCYLQVDNGPWTRVPPGPDTFITPTKPGEFDLTQYLKSLTPSPPPPQITLHLECWGWHGGALIYLGEATETIKQGQVQLQAPNWKLIGSLSVQQQLLKSGIPNPDIVPPFGLMLTEDVNQCIAHSPQNSYWATECPKDVSAHIPFLIWTWGGTMPMKGQPEQHIDGFHVYLQQKDEPEPKLFATVDPSQTQLNIMFSPQGVPTDAFVRAYSGSSESADSNWVPLTMKQTSFELAPGKQAWVKGNQNSGCEWDGDVNAAFNGQDIPPNLVTAGFIFTDDDCDYANSIYQGLVWFDVSKVSPVFTHAQLTYKLKESLFQVGGDTATPEGQITCASQLMLGKNNWLGGASTIYADPYIALPYGQQFAPWTQPEFSFDVTNAVRQWVQGSRPNYGFVFNEPYWFYDQDFGNPACVSGYGDFVIDVTDYAP